MGPFAGVELIGRTSAELIVDLLRFD
jgi:hypothetical protein